MLHSLKALFSLSTAVDQAGTLPAHLTDEQTETSRLTNGSD